MKKDRSCSGKKRHRTQGFAVIVMKRMDNAQLNTYRCHTCGQWHIGHSNKDYKFQRRIDQLLARSLKGEELLGQRSGIDQLLGQHP